MNLTLLVITLKIKVHICWINTNCKIIRLTSQLHFLNRCKYNNVFPAHFSHIYSVSKWLKHFRSIRKFNKTLYNTKKGFKH